MKRFVSLQLLTRLFRFSTHEWVDEQYRLYQVLNGERQSGKDDLIPPSLLLFYLFPRSKTFDLPVLHFFAYSDLGIDSKSFQSIVKIVGVLRWNKLVLFRYNDERWRKIFADEVDGRSFLFEGRVVANDPRAERLGLGEL
jgi:hypothetical protein